MLFAWDTMHIAQFIISLLVIIGLYGFLFLMYSKIVKRLAGYLFVSISFAATLVCFLFNLTYVFVAVVGLTAVGVTISLFTNLGDLRQFLANPFKGSRVKSGKMEVEKIYNRELLYKTIEKAVINLSKTRTGAIMTFEKNTSLQDVIKNGVAVRAPVSAELLVTIFYPGTRLHDGAVVIHGNEIVAASVFYTPTTKPFAGKYGSRHRAALGISEISDSVTVVVSEETGRISFAVNGQLDPVDQESFLRVFENYMDGVTE
ncbi:MAG: diadenylate cyclase [Bacilli bacterium]|nr:diadenylate cyclase [Bacilli bacterium]